MVDFFGWTREHGTSFRELSDDDDCLNAMLLRKDREKYEAGETASALAAFVMCYHNGIYPPVWVMDWLGDAMSAYLNAGGRCDLEKRLGLAAPGRGKDKPAAKWHRYAHRKSLGVSVWVCVRLLNVPIDEAAYKVIRRHESKGNEGEALPSSEWLAEECRRVWLSHCDAESETWRKLFGDGISLKKFADSFPEDCRPSMG